MRHAGEREKLVDAPALIPCGAE